MKKGVKKMYKHLEEMLGDWHAGLLIALLCDAFDNFVEGSDEGRNLRTIEIKLNNFFSTKYNCIKGEYEK